MGLDELVAKIGAMTPEERLSTVTIDSVIANDNVITIQWSGVQGFGEYLLYKEPIYDTDPVTGWRSIAGYRWVGNSEHMDSSSSDKRFLRHLFNEFIDEITIDG